MKAGWPLRTLNEVCDLSTGGTPARSVPEYYDGGTINWVVSGDVHRKQVWGCENKITELGLRNSNAKLLPKDSVLIALNGQGKTRGTVAMLRVEAACNQSIVCMTPKDRSKLRAEFLFLYLEGLYQQLRNITGDRDRRGLNMVILRGLTVPVPPLPEQNRIVSLLDEALEDIGRARVSAERNRQNAVGLFESYREAIFTGRGPGWVERPLSEVCAIKHGLAFEGQFFSSEGEYVLLTPGNFFETGGYRDRGEKQKYYTGHIPHDYVLKKGDLLVAMTEQAPGLLGSPILVPESDRFLHNQRLGLVTGRPGVPWTNEFFFHVFNSRSVRKAIHDSASGVKVRHTSPTKIGQVPVAFPSSPSEQNHIVTRLGKFARQTQRLVDLYHRKVTTLEVLKQALLHQAFLGAWAAGR